MQIDGSSPYAIPSPIAKAQTPSSGTPYVPELEAEKARAAANPTPNAVTGATTSKLAPETAKAAMQATQDVGASGETTRTPDDIERDYFREIVEDSEKAKRKAWELGNGELGLIIPEDVFKRMHSQGRLSEIGIDLSRSDHPVQVMTEERKAFYDQMVKDGVPPLEMIERLYQFNINLPSSYSDDVLDPTNSYPEGFYRDWHQDQLAKFNSAIEEFHGSRDTAA